MSGLPRRILLATNNPAKQDMFRWLFKWFDVELVCPRDVGVTLELAEECGTHLAIAQTKAIAWSRAAGMAAISSDGGLVIPALGERWDALRTSRFAGRHAGDAERIARLLEMMEPYSGDERGAYWGEAVALADSGKVIVSWEVESAPGLLAETYHPALGIPGFWAFSLWYLPQYGKTYSQLTHAEREALDDHWARLRAQVHAFFKVANKP